ncbi:cobalamin-binding protein [Thalassobacillus pellis]|uniref:cobalamin-binding protein n=1 Tax=Thalassobacillus pellis TaxID=748008 RepID=UPI0019606E28|nr:cobalamin-binding protein [Thalassobacillus pellis]MBM7551138.1 iron complex transport system substrate-binding protein [Thalassobacillus pellis]
MRLVSICPSNTELVAYLDKVDLLVGIDDYSDWPESTNSLPRLGPDLDIDMDKLESLDPDLVLASLSVPGMEKNIKGLEDRNIPYIILNPNSLEEIALDVEAVGHALGEENKGKHKAQVFRDAITHFSKLAEGIEVKPKLYWEWWPKPIFTPGKINWLTEVSALAGAENIFATENEASVQTDWEDVRMRDPDQICMVWVGVKEEKMNPDLIKKRPGWENMKAVKRNDIHVLEESLYCRPSPRLLEGIEKLASLLHPEVFNP